MDGARAIASGGDRPRGRSASPTATRRSASTHRARRARQGADPLRRRVRRVGRLRASPTTGPSRRTCTSPSTSRRTELVDAFHRAGVEAGSPDDGAPGAASAVRRRTTTAASCATPTATASRRSPTPAPTASRARSTTCGCAARDLDAAKAFYETIGPFVGLGLGDDSPTASSSSPSAASFSFIAGERADRARPPRLRRADQRAGRRVPRGRRRGRLHGQRRARRARRLPPRLLRGLRPRSRRPQHRGRQPQPLGGRVSAASAASTSDE